MRGGRESGAASVGKTPGDRRELASMLEKRAALLSNFAAQDDLFGYD
jgi:hypothetical protein